MAPKVQNKTITKRVVKKKRVHKPVERYSLWHKLLFVFIIIIVASALVFSYSLGKRDGLAQYKVVKPPQKHTALEFLEELSKIESIKEKKIKEKKVQETKIKEEKVLKEVLPKVEEVAKIEEVKKPLLIKRVRKLKLSSLKNGKPKLVIIIDDVCSAKQLRKIKELPMNITPSIFPPYKYSIDNHKLAEGLEHYMVHLPLESGKRYDKYHTVLMKNDTKKTIENRVKEIRQLFPTAHYLNNHIGSKFTRDYKATYRLYAALRKEGFIFVDSRTIGSSKVREVAKQFKDTYIGRDIFIDNQRRVSRIHKQLRRVVRIAKKKGYAIAIGHPHRATMRALRSAKHILKDVEVVYMDELFEEEK